MPHPGLPHGNSFDPSVHLVSEHSFSPGTHPEIPGTEPAYGHGDLQAQISSQPANDCPSKRAPLGTGDDPGIHYQVVGGGGHMSHPHAGSTSFSSPPFVTRRHSHHPLIDVRDQESARNNHEKNRNTTFGTLQSTAAPHEGVYRTAMPSEGVEHTMGDSPSLLPSPIERGQYVRTAGRSRRSRGQAVLVNPESNYGVYQARNRSVGAHRIPINHDRGPKDPVQVYGTPALPRNRASRLGGGPHQGQTTHGRDAPALHMLCTDDNRLNCQTTADHPMRGRSGGTSDISKLAEHSNTHDPGTPRRERYQGFPAPMENLRRRPHGGNSGGYQQSPAARLSIVTPHGSRRPIRIVQTTYRSATRQDGWARQPPIEFEWLKLTDAANPSYTGSPALNDRAFNHEDVGGTISCRLNFSENEIGRSKISKTNHKSTPEPITKKKLAFGVAKLVKRYIEDIKAQQGYGDVTFENVVLTSLHHVSKSSWQPELWYEVVTPARNLP